MDYIVVTGTSRGIGFELSKLLADAGYAVLALSRNDSPIKNIGHKNITAFPFDVSSAKDREKVNEYLKANNAKVLALINNAGKLVNKPFMEITEEEFKSVYDVNVFGVASMTKLIVPFMDNFPVYLHIALVKGLY